MEYNLSAGMTAKIDYEVKETDTSANFGNGGIRVFATPTMITLMEEASLKAVDQYLPEGYSTVGLTVNVSHIAATPVGMKVTVTAELLEIEGKKLTFKVEAYDEVEKIGEGVHQRYIINVGKFIDKILLKGKRE